MMIDFASSLNHGDFDDVKDFTNAKKMWNKLAQIHGGDKNGLTATT